MVWRKINIILILLSVIILITCYRNITLESTNEEIEDCHNDTNYTGNNISSYLAGYYYVIDVDSLEGDMIVINNDNTLYFLDRFDKGWVIHDKGELILKHKKNFIEIKSNLDVMNGDFYKCGYILLNSTLNVKFYFLKK